MLTQKEDLQFGEAGELASMPLLETYLNTKLIRCGGYSLLDFRNENQTVWAELKTRRCSSTQYPTLMVGKNKVDSCRDPSRAYWFAFALTDGLYAIQYDKALFDTFEVRAFQRFGRPDARDREALYVYIPTKHLNRVPSIPAGSSPLESPPCQTHSTQSP